MRPRPEGRVAVVPSLLSADPGALRRDAAALASGGARWISLDVMDGHFVPNLTYGPAVLKALRRRGGLLLDAHLMVDDPEKYGPAFAEAGADWVIFHLEACPRPRPLLRRLRGMGVGVGLAVKPATPASKLIPFLPDIDLALIMTVEPGFGAQAFLPAMLRKIRAVRKAIDASGRRVWLQVDGGIYVHTGALAAGAGADSLVAGSGVFGAKDPVAAMRAIRKAAQSAFEKRTM
ncbi:MAG: ribulose-phosphate 3-epimerase [Elusimicrobia bacterium]|nr:ribulose-phosphate 3-epimerase [Elusimicrobiota bacterium]